MKLYNLEKLIKITISDSFPARFYTLKNEIKIMGFTIQKAGLYDSIFRPYKWSGTEIPEGHFIKNGKLYEYPEVILHYQNDHSKVYIFKTYKQAQEFVKKIASSGTFIE